MGGECARGHLGHSSMSHLKIISVAAMLFVILFSIGLGFTVLVTTSLQVTLTLKVDQCTSNIFRFFILNSCDCSDGGN